MNMQAKDGFAALTDKEKQTLRLIVRGHDAKSTARNLGLSVHTINERLRDARRKMAVSSSREAARLLLAAEGGDAALITPQRLGDNEIGADPAPVRPDQAPAPMRGARRTDRRPLILIGVVAMTLALSLLALAALSQPTSAPSATPAPAQSAVNSEVVDAARQWLGLLDQSRWSESYQATGSAFRKLNTAEVRRSTSEKVRAPMGAAVSRAFVSEENLPAPPAGYEVVKFRTRFADKSEAIETVTLDREDGSWRVVGVTVG